MAQTHTRSSEPRSSRRQSILIVDDEPRIVKLLAAILRHVGYRCLGCESAAEALAVMNTQAFDAVLCDLHMPGISGLEFLHIVRERDRHVGFMMITGEGDIEVGIRAMKEGADDYLLKPLAPEDVEGSVEHVLQRKRREAEVESHRLHLEEVIARRNVELKSAVMRMKRADDETLQALAAALDLRDCETAGHSRRVMTYAVEIARVMGCNKAQVRAIARGALLHDIGKIGIPDAILMKPGALAAAERCVMETHALRGFDLLNSIGFMQDAAEIVLTHHERFDGMGYPRRLKGDQIPLGARVFAAADTLDAMTSDRPYRPATTVERAREEIMRESGKQFDPKVVSAFLSVEARTWDRLRRNQETPRLSVNEGVTFIPPTPASQALISLKAMA
jgi:putative nucleotidyltransferase with HDIG domain